MKFSVPLSFPLLALSLAFVFSLAACGGGGGSANTEESLRGNLSGQTAVTESHIFFTKIVPESLTEQPVIELTKPPLGALQDQYLISTLDQEKSLNDAISPENKLTFNDLANTVYFLITASDCPAPSSYAGAEYGADQVTIRIQRYQGESGTACSDAAAKRFHVFKAAKYHAPETLFESVPDVSSYAITGARTVVVSNASAWADLWAAHYSQSTTVPPLPAVDFSQNMVVGVYLGARPNGCYGVGIDRIYQSASQNIVENIVEYTEWTPAAGDICTEALVYPVQLVVVPKSADPFTFIKTVRARS